MKFITLIPTKRNDGSAVSSQEMLEILESLWSRFGGLQSEGPINGHWIDSQDGRHFRDECLRVTVACDNERLQEAQDAVVEIGKRLNQRAMYFDIQDFDGVRVLRIV